MHGAGLLAVLLAAVLTTPPARSADPEPDARPAPAAPRAIAVPDVAARAESVVALLRAVEGAAADPAELEALDGALHRLRARVQVRYEETVRALRGRPPLSALDDLAEPWRAVHADTAAAVVTLREFAETLEADLTRLDAVRDTWSATARSAEAQDAPPSVRDRVTGTLVLVQRVREDVAARRARVLALLDRATQEKLRADEAVERLAAARRTAVAGLLVRDRAALWGVVLRDGGLAGALGEARASLKADVALGPDWLAARALPLVVQGLLIVLVAAVLRRIHRHAATWVAAEPALARTFAPLALPLTCAVLLVLLAGEYRVAVEARSVRQAVALVTLAPVVPLALRLVPAALRPAVWAAAALFLVDVARGLVVVVPPLERTVFTAELAVLCAVLLWLARGLRRAAVGASPWRVGAARVATGLAGVIALSVVAGAAGYTRLPRVLEVAVLKAGDLALVGFVLLRIGEALLAWALRVRPLRLLRAVHAHRRLVEHRLRLGLRVAALAAWGAIVLGRLGLYDPLLDLVRRVFDADYVRGGFRFSVGDLVAFLVAVWLATAVSRLVRFLLEEDVFPRVALARGLPTALSSLVHYGLITGGFLAGLALLGLTVDQITILAGALGVGIGFGLQTLVLNVLSGLILLLERPIKPGDSVQLGDLLGEVHRIGLRASTLRTWQGAEVIVPNATLVGEQVTNWTLSDRLVRVEVALVTEDGVDPTAVCALLRSVAEGHPAVLPEPAPEALFEAFEDGGLRFRLQAWTARAEGRFEEWLRVRSDLGGAVWRALADAGVPLAGRQQDVRLAEVASGAATVLRGAGVRG